ncbi:MAG: hypothetical protein K8R79_04740 [Calditrichales bacterium]|nr:hypothetical protein [Calditrichales bacterium]
MDKKLIELEGDLMIAPINTTNAIHVAYDGLKKASNNVNIATQQISEGNIEADKLLALEVQKQNAKVQAVSLKSVIEHSENIIA